MNWKVFEKHLITYWKIYEIDKIIIWKVFEKYLKKVRVSKCNTFAKIITCKKKLAFCYAWSSLDDWQPMKWNEMMFYSLNILKQLILSHYY